MQKIFQEYGGVITVAVAIVALIGIVAMLIGGPNGGLMGGAFEQLVTDFEDKASAKIDGVGGNGGGGQVSLVPGATFSSYFTSGDIDAVEVKEEITLTWEQLKAMDLDSRPFIVMNDIVSDTEIGSQCFESSNIKSIVIPYGVESIGDFAFYGNNLVSVIIPKSVTFIGDFAFEDTAITQIDFVGSMEEFNACSANWSSAWNEGSSIERVVCTDGTITL